MSTSSEHDVRPAAGHDVRAAPAARHRTVIVGHLITRYGLLILWLVEVAVFSILSPDVFFTTQNFQTMLSSQAVLVVIALGLVFPLMASEFDLSVGGVLGVSLVVLGYLNVVQDWPILVAVAAALGVGAVVGALHVLFVVVLGVESIIITLGSGTILAGAAFGVNSLAIGGISSDLVALCRTEFLGIQLVFYWSVLFTAALWYVVSYTPLGRYLFFVGANREAARLAGIQVDKVRAIALATASLMSAVAGVMLAGVLGGADPSAGGDYLLPTFAAVFLGATVVNPGRFNPWGTFIAVYFLVTGVTGLQIMGLSGWIEQVFYGVSLILGVTVSRIATRRRTSTTDGGVVS